MHAAVTLTRRTESTLREEHLRRDSAGVMTASVVRVRKASGGTTARLDDSCGRHRRQARTQQGVRHSLDTALNPVDPQESEQDGTE